MEADEYEKKSCLRCKEEFQPRREWQKWCTAECRITWYRETLRDAKRRA